MKQFKLMHGTGEGKHLVSTADHEKRLQLMRDAFSSGVGGIDCDPDVIKTWPEDQESAARAELARHRCTYRIEQAFSATIVTADEWALAVGEVDEDGFFEEAGMYYADADYIDPDYRQELECDDMAKDDL